MLLYALACFTPSSGAERCDRCADPEVACAPADAQACRVLSEMARIADPVDAAAAITYADRACGHGDGPACAALGLRHEDGLGLPDNDVLALELFDRSCELGAGVGCFNAGLMYLSGHGVPRDEATATAWFTRAEAAWRVNCDAGELEWCLNLGVLHQQGLGVPKDPPAALGIYDAACTAGNTDACVNAAWMRLYGEGVPADEPAGIAAIRQACDGGSALGCGALGQLYVVDAYGIAPDGPRAVELLERACHAGDAHGCNVLGGVYGMGDRVPADPAAAAWYSARACDLGGSVGCFANGMAAESRADADSWLARACGMGNAEGCLALGSVRAAEGAGFDPTGSVAALTSACQLGLWQGCATLIALGAPLPEGAPNPPADTPVGTPAAEAVTPG